MTESNSELYFYNKEAMNSIKGMFTPHFNLYQKAILQEKIDCFDKHYKAPSSYYECVEKVDERMAKNSALLQKKFQSIDHFKSECEEKCKSGDPNAVNLCLKGCTDAMKENAVEAYKRFYEGQISSHPEYKSIKF